MVFLHERYCRIGNGRWIAVPEFQNRHQRARQLRLPLPRFQHVERRIKFNIGPCLGEGGAQNLGFDRIEDAALKLKRAYRFSGRNSVAMRNRTRDRLCGRLGRSQEALPVAFVPQTPFILSQKYCLSPRSHSIFVNIPSAASAHSRRKTFAMQHTERTRFDNACEIVVQASRACREPIEPPFHGLLEVRNGMGTKCALKA